MKILIYTAVWKRPEITEICFMSIKRLQKVPGFKVSGFAVISEPEMIPLCEKYGIDWCLTANHPLGAKKNHGIKQALFKNDFEYLIEVGSDDLLKNEILTTYKWDAAVLGLMDFAIINTANGACKRIQTNIPKYGAGRAVKRFVLESCELWNNKISRGMDNNSSLHLAQNGFMPHGVKTDSPLVVALKSEMNLWSYTMIGGSKYPLDDALNGLSEEEINAIRCLVTKNKSADLIGA